MPIGTKQEFIVCKTFDGTEQFPSILYEHYLCRLEIDELILIVKIVWTNLEIIQQVHFLYSARFPIQQMVGVPFEN